MTGTRRSWMLLGALLALVLTYLTVWSTYAAVHTYPRYAQLPAGATATVGAAHYRVTKMISTEVAAASEGEDTPAPAGTVFVIATVEVTIDQPVDTLNCSLNLLGPGGRLWDTGFDAPRRSLPTYCDSEKPPQPGQPYAFENIFEIPSGYAGDLRGLVVPNPVSSKPEQVIIPG